MDHFSFNVYNSGKLDTIDLQHDYKTPKIQRHRCRMKQVHRKVALLRLLILFYVGVHFSVDFGSKGL